MLNSHPIRLVDVHEVWTPVARKRILTSSDVDLRDSSFSFFSAEKRFNPTVIGAFDISPYCDS
jgi:hypothetical protein